MNEFIRIRFKRQTGARFKVVKQTPDGIEFDERDPIERTVGVQINPRGSATAERMRRIARVKGWGLNEFKLRVSVEEGDLILRGHDPDALPEGLYAIRVAIEEAATPRKNINVEIKQDGHAAFDVPVMLDVRDLEVDLTDSDSEIQRVLDASRVDGRSGADWVKDRDRRPTRRACLLNLLASLRVRPTARDRLIDQVKDVFMVFNDRAYMRVDRAMLQRVEDLARDPKTPFFREGKPAAKIHGRLLDSIQEKQGFSELLSFRGEGAPSLQMVIAVPPVDSPHTYAEFDLDLGNPLQDVLGFVVHMGELLDGKPTNHLELRKALAKSKAGSFLYYKVSEG